MNYFSTHYITSSIARLATQYVGQYLEGIEPEKFAVAWKAGNLSLTDVRIRKEAIDVLNLPVTLIHGWIGLVKISLPFGNIFSLRAASSPQPLVIELDELYVILAPKPDHFWEATALTEQYKLSRQRLLDECDVKLLAVQAQEQLAQNIASNQTGWMARLASRVLADIQFQFRSIHIRYEDAQHNFALGISLSQLQIRTPSKQDWEVFVSSRLEKHKGQSNKNYDIANTFKSKVGSSVTANRQNADTLKEDLPSLEQQKLLHIINIAVYSSLGHIADGHCSMTLCKSENGMLPATQEHINQRMRNMILTGTGIGFAPGSSFETAAATPAPYLHDHIVSSTRTQTSESNFGYLLRPFSCSVGVEIGTISQKKGSGASTETKQRAFYKLLVSLALLDIKISNDFLRNLKIITTNMSLYKELLAAVEDRYELYYPYRPVIPVRGSAKIWWKYAVGCVIRRLNKNVPEALRTRPSPWDWGGHLKEARVAAWRAEYQAALTASLQAAQSADSTVFFMDSNNQLQRELYQLQELLPRKELLQAYIETKQAFLGISLKDQQESLNGSTAKMTTSKEETPRVSWIGGFFQKKSLPKDEKLPDEVNPFQEEESFYDVLEADDDHNRIDTLSLPQKEDLNTDSFADAQETPFLLRKTDYREMQKKQQQQQQQFTNSGMEDGLLQQQEDIVDILLAADEIAAEAYLDLEAVTLSLQMSKKTSVTSTISDLRVAFRLEEQYTVLLALQDLAMCYETPENYSQKFLTRRIALDKDFFFLYFSTKDPQENAPKLVTHTQHVLFVYIPAVVKECKELLTLLGFSSSPSLTESSAFFSSPADNTPDRALEHLSTGFISSEKLSSAKQLAANAYNKVAILDVNIAAPTIVLPAPPMKARYDISCQMLPVLVIHLGSLSVKSSESALPPPEPNPYMAGRLVTYLSSQEYNVSLRETHVEYFETYNHFINSTSKAPKGLSVIDRFELTIALSLRSSQEKNMLKAFLGTSVTHAALRPRLTGSIIVPDSTTASMSPSNVIKLDEYNAVNAPNPQLASSSAPSLTPLQHSIDIRGKLPLFSINLNTHLLESFVSALSILTSDDTITSSNNEKEKDSKKHGLEKSTLFNNELGESKNDGLLQHGDLILSRSFGKNSKALFESYNGHNLSLFKGQQQPLDTVVSKQKRDHVAQKDSLRQMISDNNNNDPYCITDSNDTYIQENEEAKKDDTCKISNNGDLEYIWPPDLTAIFSLSRFQLSVCCNSPPPPPSPMTETTEESQKEICIDLITENTTAGITVRSGLTSIDFCLEELSLLRPDIPIGSPYRYILETSLCPISSTALLFPFEKPSSTHDSETKRDDILKHNEEKEKTKFILIKTLLASNSWNKNHYCYGASTLVDISFSRFLRITFQPKPLEDYILFWRCWPESEEDRQNLISTTTTPPSPYSKPPFESAVNNTDITMTQRSQHNNIVPILKSSEKQVSYNNNNTILTREKDQQEYIIKLSVLGVSCTCIEHPSNAIFAACEFDSMFLELGFRTFGTDVTCRLKNLHITDLSAMDGYKRQLFGVISEEGCLLSIECLTTDPSSPYFDGTSLHLLVDFAQVEVVCLIQKLLRIFNWIFRGLLSTLTVCPPSLSQQPSQTLLQQSSSSSNVSTHNNKIPELELKKSLVEYNKTLSTFKRQNEILSSPGNTSEQQQQSHEGYSKFRKGVSSSSSSTLEFQQSEPQFQNHGEKVLASWLMRAAMCMARLGDEELFYLKKKCQFILPSHQRFESKNYTIENQQNDILLAPLTLRNYKISIRSPTLIIPVSTYDTKHARLTIDSITISNSPIANPQYGLLDDIKIFFKNMTIHVGNTEDVILGEVDIDVHYMQSLLTVTPQHPLWLSFHFSDVPWFLTSERFNLLLSIIFNNVIGDDPDTSVVDVIHNVTSSDSTNDTLKKNQLFTLQEYQIESEDTNNINTIQQEQSFSFKSIHYNTQSNKISHANEQQPFDKNNFSLLQHESNMNLNYKHSTSNYPEYNDNKCIIDSHNTISPIDHEDEDSVSLTSLFDFVLPDLFVFLSPNEENCNNTISLHADLLQCQITKTSKGLMSVQITANATRVVHCKPYGFPFRLILSDSRKNLTLIALHEILKFQRLTKMPKHYSAKIPKDILNFIDRINTQNDCHFHDLNELLNTVAEEKKEQQDFFSTDDLSIGCNNNNITSTTTQEPYDTQRKTNSNINNNHLSLTLDDVKSPEELFCIYQSYGNNKDLHVRINDPRLIVEKSFIESILAFFSNVSYEDSVTTLPSDDSNHGELLLLPSTTHKLQTGTMEEPLQSTVGETSFTISIRLVNASLIVPEFFDDASLSPLLVMRGSFEANRSRVITCSAPEDIASLNNGSIVNYSQENSSTAPDVRYINNKSAIQHGLNSHNNNNNISSANFREQLCPSASITLTHTHYSLSVSAMDLFTCDLLTLSSLEIFEASRRYTSKTSLQHPINNNIHQEGADIHNDDDACTNPDEALTQLYETQDNLYIHDFVQQFSKILSSEGYIRNVKRTTSFLISDVLNSHPAHFLNNDNKPERHSLADLLHVPASLLITTDKKLTPCHHGAFSSFTPQLNETGTNNSIPNLQQSLTYYTVDAGCNWEDLIRLMCPNVECVIDLADKHQEINYCIRDGSSQTQQLLNAPNVSGIERTGVISIQPINIEVSYNDIRFIHRIFNRFISNTSEKIDANTSSTQQHLSNTLAISPSNTKDSITLMNEKNWLNKSTDDSNNQIRQPYVKTHLDCDLAEVKILLLNDTMGFLSAPFLEFAITSGSLSADLDESQSPLPSFELTLSLAMKFFNPRAVSFEPVLETFRLKLTHSTFQISESQTEAKSIKKMAKKLQDIEYCRDIRLLGSSKTPMCVNISNIFIASCLQNYHRWEANERNRDNTALISSSTAAGMFRFTPYSLRNNTGMNLRISIPFNKHNRRLFRLGATLEQMRVTLFIHHQQRRLKLGENIDTSNKTPFETLRNDDARTNSNNTTILQPGDTYRLRQLEVDIHDDQKRSSFKVQLKLLHPLSPMCAYALDGLVPVGRLGVYLFKTMDTVDTTITTAANPTPWLKEEDVTPSHLGGQLSEKTHGLVTTMSQKKQLLPRQLLPTSSYKPYVICRVDVTDGQKHLNVESQVLVENNLGDTLGLEVAVNFFTGSSSMSSSRLKFIVPPNGNGGVPAYACGSSNLAFRPIVWKPEMMQKNANFYESPESSWSSSGTTLPYSAVTAESNAERQQPLNTPSSATFSWSKSIQLASLWKRVDVVEREKLSETENNFLDSNMWFPSGLPKFLPVESLACRYRGCVNDNVVSAAAPDTNPTVISQTFSRSDLPSSSFEYSTTSYSSKNSHSISSGMFFMAAVVHWNNYSYRDRTCRQLRVVLEPPFLIRSTIPSSVAFKLKTSTMVYQQEPFFYATTLSDKLKETQKIQTISTTSGSNSTIIRQHPTMASSTLSSGFINLLEELRLFSLPLHETASISIDPFNNPMNLTQSLRIFQRIYPHSSLRDGVEESVWKKFWLEEGGSGTHSMPKTHIAHTVDKDGFPVRFEIVVTSKPGHPVEIILHSPIWLLSYLSLSSSAGSLGPMAFAYPDSNGDVKDTPSKPKLRRFPKAFYKKNVVSMYDYSHINSELIVAKRNLNPTTLEMSQHIMNEETFKGGTPGGSIIPVGVNTTSPEKQRTATLRHRYTANPTSTMPEPSNITDPIFVEATIPYCIPLDSEAKQLQLLLTEFESNTIMLEDVQQDQLLQILVPMLTDVPILLTNNQTTSTKVFSKRSSALETPGNKASGSSNNTPSSKTRICDFACRVSQCPLPLAKEVKWVSIAHRYFLQNDTQYPLLYRQHQTRLCFRIDIGHMRPIEWVDATKPQYISLRPDGPGWFWSGRVCPFSIEAGGDFICHFSPDPTSGKEDYTIRIEKHLPSATLAPFASIILRLYSNSLDLPDAVQFVNHTRYDFFVRQHQTPQTRAFRLLKGASLNFGWDDALLPRSIFLIPEHPHYENGAIVELAQLASGKSQLIRLSHTSSRFWFTLIALREGSLRVLHLFNYDDTVPQTILDPISRQTQPLAQPTTGSLSQKFCSKKSHISEDLSTVATPRIFIATSSFLPKAKLSITISLPAVYFSIISDLPPLQLVTALTDKIDKAGWPSEELWLRHQRLATTSHSFGYRNKLDLFPTEFLTIYLEDCRARYISNQLHEDMFAMLINDIQVDNPHPTTVFPVVLQRLGVSSSTTLRNYERRRLLADVELEVDIEKHPLVDVLIKRRLDHEDPVAITGTAVPPTNTLQSLEEHKCVPSPVTQFSLVRIILLGFIVKSDMDFINSTFLVVRSFNDALKITGSLDEQRRRDSGIAVESSSRKKRLTSHGMSVLETSSLSLQSQSLLSYTPPPIKLTLAFSTRKCYFEKLLIHPLLFRLSFSPASSALSNPYAEGNSSRGLFMRLFSTLGSVQEVPIYFKAFSLYDQTKANPALIATLKAFYTPQALRQSYALATSVDVLGNPLSTLSHIGAGLGDLVADPVRCLNETGETSNVMEGLGKGAKSFWDNAVYGAFNVVSKMSGVAAQGLGVLALDEEYARERLQQGNRRRPKDATEGLTMGAEAFSRAVVGGLKGLVTEPSKGAEEKGFEGLIQGVGKGVVGALVKPVAGVFELTALATGGAQEAAGESSGVARGKRIRKRPPRLFYGSDRIIREYDARDALLNDGIIYLPGIDWERYIVDTIIHDDDFKYATILNNDELLTVALQPEPHIDIYCDLWNIASCEAVELSKNIMDDSSRCDSNLFPFMARTTPTTSNRQHVKTIGFFGTALKLHAPQTSRCIRTSTLEIAQQIATCINEKLSRL